MTNTDGGGHPPTSDDPLSGAAAPDEQQPAAGDGQPATAGYPQHGQPAAAGYGQEPVGGYEQPATAGYPQQPTGGYEQPAGYTEQPPAHYQPPQTYDAPGTTGGYGATSQPGPTEQAGAMYGATSQPGDSSQPAYGATSQPGDPNQPTYGATSQPGQPSQPSQPSPTAPYEQHPAAGYQPPLPHEPSTQPYATGYTQGDQPTAVYGATSQPGHPGQPAVGYGATSQPGQPDHGYQSAPGYGHQPATGYQPPQQPQQHAGAASMATVPMATAAPAAAPAASAAPAPHYPAQAAAPYPGQQAYVPGQYDGAYDAGPPELEHQRRPFTIWLVSLLMWLGALGAIALGVTVLVLGMTARQALFAELAAIPGFQEIEAVFTTAIIAIGAVAIIGGLLYFLLSISAFRGSNPVRWVLVVFMILSALGWIPVLAIVIGNIDDASIMLMSFLPFLALLLFVVLYLLPPAGAWYRYRGELKRQARAAGH